MPDVFTKEKRSLVMSRIRGRGNKDTELAFAKILRAAGITGWRRHTNLIGRPDFTFRKQRVVIFVDGCFWHCCPKHSNMPANNREFWLKKLSGNKTRDRLVTRTLRNRGWRVIRIWEHELRTPARVIARVRALTASHPCNRPEATAPKRVRLSIA
jgi:DNA mismatch endonuclease, patch repair protein